MLTNLRADITRSTYNMLRNDVINNITYNGNNWAYNIKSMLDNIGLGFLWDNQDTIENINYAEIKTRLFDIAT